MSGRDNYDFLSTLGGGGGAPTNASYVVIALNGTLTAERVLTAGAGISITDGGAGGNVTIAATGSGGANVGTATVDFGAFPGSSHASVVVTGQAGIVAGSVVQAWVRPVATADHSADEHMLETLKVHASDIVAGAGFTINVFNDGTINEPDVAAVSRDGVSQIAARPGGRGQQDGLTAAVGGKGTRIYGQWTIAWSWS